MNASQPQLLKGLLSPGDAVWTPEWVARDMVHWFIPDDTTSILEPCRGDGNIWKYLPHGSMWCEIARGRDFFAWHKKVDWIITNPPYSIFREFLEHALGIAQNVVFLIPLHNIFRNGRVLKMSKARGWMRHIRYYGGGSEVGFPMGNPIAAVHWKVGYLGDTSWSWYEDLLALATMTPDK